MAFGEIESDYVFVNPDSIEPIEESGKIFVPGDYWGITPSYGRGNPLPLRDTSETSDKCLNLEDPVYISEWLGEMVYLLNKRTNIDFGWFYPNSFVPWVFDREIILSNIIGSVFWEEDNDGDDTTHLSYYHGIRVFNSSVGGYGQIASELFSYNIGELIGGGWTRQDLANSTMEDALFTFVWNGKKFNPISESILLKPRDGTLSTGDVDMSSRAYYLIASGYVDKFWEENAEFSFRDRIEWLQKSVVSRDCYIDITTAPEVGTENVASIFRDFCMRALYSNEVPPAHYDSRFITKISKTTYYNDNTDKVHYLQIPLDKIYYKILFYGLQTLSYTEDQSSRTGNIVFYRRTSDKISYDIKEESWNYESDKHLSGWDEEGDPEYTEDITDDSSDESESQEEKDVFIFYISRSDRRDALWHVMHNSVHDGLSYLSSLQQGTSGFIRKINSDIEFLMPTSPMVSYHKSGKTILDNIESFTSEGEYLITQKFFLLFEIQCNNWQEGLSLYNGESSFDNHPFTQDFVSPYSTYNVVVPFMAVFEGIVSDSDRKNLYQKWKIDKSDLVGFITNVLNKMDNGSIIIDDFLDTPVSWTDCKAPDIKYPNPTQNVPDEGSTYGVDSWYNLELYIRLIDITAACQWNPAPSVGLPSVVIH